MNQSLLVHGSNVEQARAWDGSEGANWAARAEQFDAALCGYQPGLLSAAEIAPADHVLDIGCGAGRTTLDAARLVGDGWAHGVDLSAALLEVARDRARVAGARNVSFEQADAQIHPFQAAGFDVVISRTAVMFFGDVQAGFANMTRALRPGGRLVLLVWQGIEANPWFTQIRAVFAAGRSLPPPPVGQPGPFALADPERLRTLAEGCGLTAVSVRPQRHPIVFGPDPGSAQQLLVGQFGGLLADLTNAARADVLAALSATLVDHQTSAGVAFPSAAWLVTARR